MAPTNYRPSAYRAAQRLTGSLQNTQTIQIRDLLTKLVSYLDLAPNFNRVVVFALAHILAHVIATAVARSPQRR